MFIAPPSPISPVPPAIEQFLLERVATHEQLQSLLTLLNSGDEAMTASELEAIANLPDGEGYDALEALVDAQLVVREGGEPARYRYAPGRSGLDAMVRLLALIYSQHRYEVVRVMGDNAMKRMWSAARLAFLVALAAESRKSGPASRRRPRPRWARNADTRGGNV
jgi:hypothetical protein